jgi:hypothetical protein
VDPTTDTILGHGTRNPDTVDAGGPYGEGIPFDPYYEGDPITFEASIEPEDEEENYQLRWDVDGDGKWDGPGDSSTEYFGEDGDMDFTRTFYDDYQGKALVEAWDGSWTTKTGGGNLLNEKTDEYGYTYYGYSTSTRGYTFEVTQDVQVTKLGCYRNSYGDPSSYYNLRIWDDTPSVIAYVNSPGTPIL